MGNILSTLAGGASAAPQDPAAVQSALQGYDTAAAQTYDPGIVSTGSHGIVQAPGLPDPTGVGLSQSGGQDMSQAPTIDYLSQASDPFSGMSAPVQQDPQQPATPMSYATPDNQYTPDDGQTLTSAANLGTQQDDPAITITADNWQPHKETLLQHIGDWLLGGYFNKMNQMHNLESAEQGTQNDPLQRIARVEKFSPQLALKMQYQYDALHKDDDETKARLNYWALKNDDAITTHIGNAIGSLPEDPEQARAAYAKLRPVWQAYNDKYGGSIQLPQEYDRQQLDAIRFGGYNVAQQEDDKRAVEQFTIRQNDLNASRQETLAVRKQIAAANIEARRQMHDESLAANDPAMITARKVLGQLPANPKQGTLINSKKDPRSGLYFYNGKWYMVRKTAPGIGHVQVMGLLPGQDGRTVAQSYVAPPPNDSPDTDNEPDDNE